MELPREPTDGQLEMAAELGIDPAGMSFAELKAAIWRSPPTDAQLNFITVLFAERSWPVPPDMTFGQAYRILDEVAPLTNEKVLADHGWEENDILHWRDGYYQLTKIHANFTITLARVELVAGTSGENAVVEPTKEPKKLRHPFTLSSEDAQKVNLSTVRPD